MSQDKVLFLGSIFLYTKGTTDKFPDYQGVLVYRYVGSRVMVVI